MKISIALAVPAGLDGRRPGVAGGGADDGDALAALFQDMIEQPAEQLHAHSP